MQDVSPRPLVNQTSEQNEQVRKMKELKEHLFSRSSKRRASRAGSAVKKGETHHSRNSCKSSDKSRGFSQEAQELRPSSGNPATLGLPLQLKRYLTRT